jgi:Ca2+-binding RTX toxin-like protein
MSVLLSLFIHASGASAPTIGSSVRTPSPSPTPAPVSVAYEVKLSSITVPVQCKDHTYTTAFKAPADSTVQGTSGNDIIFAGDESIIHGGAGDDCIVADFETSAYGDAGNDILISKTGDNILDGGTGNDTAYYHAGTDIIQNIETANKL